MNRPPYALRFMRYMARAPFLSDARRLELYPPFLMMRIKVLEIADGWRRIRIRLPLNTVSRNPGGVMFGGFQAALADPIPALACARIFPGQSVWTRAMSIRFDVGGHTDLELRFDMDPAQEEAIENELVARGRANPVFEYAYFLEDGTRCSLLTNTVAIRPAGYPASAPPAAADSVE